MPYFDVFPGVYWLTFLEKRSVKVSGVCRHLVGTDAVDIIRDFKDTFT
jgi:hypothetical protein